MNELISVCPDLIGGFADLMCGESLTRRNKRQILFSGYAADWRRSRRKGEIGRSPERQSHSAHQSGKAAGTLPEDKKLC